MAGGRSVAGRHRCEPHRGLQHRRHRDEADGRVRQRRRDRGDQFGRRPGRFGAPVGGSVGYAAAKHGMVGIMRVYANFLAPYSIRVNSVHPTGVNTPMIDNDFTRPGWTGSPQRVTRSRHGQRPAGADAVSRRTSPTRCSGWCPTPRATSPASRCPSTPGTSTSDDTAQSGSADGFRPHRAVGHRALRAAGRRLVDDDLAASFLPAGCATAGRADPGRRAAPGRRGGLGPVGARLWAIIACRKRFIDEDSPIRSTISTPSSCWAPGWTPAATGSPGTAIFQCSRSTNPSTSNANPLSYNGHSARHPPRCTWCRSTSSATTCGRPGAHGYRADAAPSSSGRASPSTSRRRRCAPRSTAQRRSDRQPAHLHLRPAGLHRRDAAIRRRRGVSTVPAAQPGVAVGTGARGGRRACRIRLAAGRTGRTDYYRALYPPTGRTLSASPLEWTATPKAIHREPVIHRRDCTTQEKREYGPAGIQFRR